MRACVRVRVCVCVCARSCAAHALPMFREARQRSTRKQLEKDRLDPMKSHKPEPPVSGPGEVQDPLCRLMGFSSLLISLSPSFPPPFSLPPFVFLSALFFLTLSISMMGQNCRSYLCIVT